MSENGKATFASLFPMDDSDPNFSTDQADLLWGKGMSKEKRKAQTHVLSSRRDSHES